MELNWKTEGLLYMLLFTSAIIMMLDKIKQRPPEREIVWYLKKTSLPWSQITLHTLLHSSQSLISERTEFKMWPGSNWDKQRKRWGGSINIKLSQPFSNYQGSCQCFVLCLSLSAWKNCILFDMDMWIWLESKQHWKHSKLSSKCKCKTFSVNPVW